MSTKIDGKQIAAEIKTNLAERVNKLKAQGIQPGLGTLLVGEDPGSMKYVAGKHADCQEVGITSVKKELPADASFDDIAAAVRELNEDPACTGFIVQLPLPKHLDSNAVLEAIDPSKYVDGFHAVNAGHLFQGRPTLVACTPFGVMQSQQPCPHCGGRGTIIKNPCKTCRGTGKTSARKTLEVKIPAGIDDDQNIALRGQGDAGTNGGPAGDVIVHVTVKPDAVFERDGYDVYVRVPITYSQAVLGAEIEVPTVDGKVAQKIPEGTQSGTKFRLRGQGIQYLNGRGRGDQYVIVDVEIPKKLNRTQREALKAFEDSLKDENYEKRKSFFKNLKDRFMS